MHILKKEELQEDAMRCSEDARHKEVEHARVEEQTQEMRQSIRIIEQALEQVDMVSRMHHYPAQLSGGQQQRVAVARALVGEPLILLADEPTGNLDSRNGGMVMDLLRDLHQKGTTVCMVTHDPRYLSYAERTIHLFDGVVVDESVPHAVPVQ